MTATLPVITLHTEDAGELLTLQRAAYVTEAAAHGDFDLLPLTQTLASLVEELSAPDVTCLGVRDGHRLVGSVRLRQSGDLVELGRLIVAPDQQGRGTGTRLLLGAEDALPDAREFRLFTGENSTANIRLYTRHGYVETVRTSAGDYDLVHMVKARP